MFFSPPPRLLIINYTLEAALSFFVRVLTHLEKKTKPTRAIFSRFIHKLKTRHFHSCAISLKKSGPGSLRRNTQRVKLKLFFVAI